MSPRMCFERHDVIGAAIGLAGDHGDLRHGRLGEGEQQLGAVLDQAAIFLVGARQEARHVDEGDDRDVEAVAEAHEARGLARGVDVEHAGQHHRLIGDDADGAAVDAGEAGRRCCVANASWISKKSPSSTTFRISSFMS